MLLDNVCPVCKTNADLKTFNSFNYYYCPNCREDVAHLKKISSPKLEFIDNGLRSSRPWVLGDVLYCFKEYGQMLSIGKTYSIILVIENEDINKTWYKIIQDDNNEGLFNYEWGQDYFELLPF